MIFSIVKFGFEVPEFFFDWIDDVAHIQSFDFVFVAKKAGPLDTLLKNYRFVYNFRFPFFV